jgi:RNA polymerase sigma factor (sigma-70 family)
VGDEDVRQRFATVVVPHLDDAFALARWLTGNTADAEDVVQDAAMRAYRGLPGFIGGSTRAWTLTIVRNCAYTWLAKNRPKAVVFTDDLEEAERIGAATLGPPEVTTAETDMIAGQEADRLGQAIATLPLPFREALVLREIQGLAYREIATMTDVPIGTVMSRLARARRLLIAALRESEP